MQASMRGGDPDGGGLAWLYGTDFMRKIVAATGASVVSAMVVVPLDVVKVQMMAANVQRVASGASASCSGTGQPTANGASQFLNSLKRPAGSGPWRPYEGRVLTFASCSGGLLECPPRAVGAAPACPPTCFETTSITGTLGRIMRQEGLPALWKGGGATLAMTIPSVGIYMPLYDHVLTHYCTNMGALGPVAAGGASRGVAVMCIAPLELFRTRIQAAQEGRPLQKLSTVDASSPTWRARASALRAMWTGCGATLLRDVPFSALYWGMLEPTRATILEQIGGDGAHPTPRQVLTANIIAGATGGYLAAGITTPFDVIKTQQQVDAKRSAMRISDVARDVVRQAGWRGLWVGAGPRSLRAAPACAIVISTYEYLKTWMEAASDGCEQS